MSRFGRQKKADLLDMTAGGDRHAGSHVNQIVILVRIKRKGSSELVQPGEDFFKIPWIFETKRVQTHFGFRADTANIAGGQFGKFEMPRLMQKIEAMNQQIFMLTRSHRRPPLRPAILRLSHHWTNRPLGNIAWLHFASAKWPDMLL